MTKAKRKKTQAGRWADAPSGSLGSRVRAARKQVPLGLRELARRVGCSPGLISQIEYGIVTPSIRTLYAIARELNVPIHDLLESPSGRNGHPTGDRASKSSDFAIAHPGQIPTIELRDGISWMPLAAAENGQPVEFREITYGPGAASCPPGEALQHKGFEYAVILEGQFTLQIGGESHVLEPGASVSFSSQVPHRLSNDTDAPARALWFIHVAHS